MCRRNEIGDRSSGNEDVSWRSDYSGEFQTYHILLKSFQNFIPFIIHQ